MGDLLLGIDAGLTTTKAALFTTDGEEVSVGSQETPVDRPAAGHREIALLDLWTTTKTAIRDAFVDVSVSPHDVTAVGVAGHGHGLYLLNDDGEQVRPAIKSTDSRATDLVDGWETDGTATEIRELLGYAPFAADPLSLLAWLDRHEPDAVDRIDRILFCKDYLKYRLTDRICTDEMEASVFYAAGGNEYEPAVFDTLDLTVGTEVLPEVVPRWKRVSSTRPGATSTSPLCSTRST